MNMASKTALTGPKEIELKFTIDPTDLAVFRNLPFLADVPSRQTSLSATYFDTDDHALHRAGYALRLRRSALVNTQTLKGPSSGSAGLFTRVETECAVAGEALDETMLQAALPGDLLAAISGRLAPVFRVDVERTDWNIETDGSVISVSVDQGTIDTGDRSAPINEVEFELKDGTTQSVFALAGIAIERVALHLQPLSKSERGYQLLGMDKPSEMLPGRAPAPTKLDVAIHRMIAILIEEIALEQPNIQAVGDVEAVHRLRVLLRRLRCLLDVAAETIAPRRFDEPLRVIRRAFQRLGRVRDLDILTFAVPQNAEVADGAMVAIAADRQLELAKARRLLASRRFAATMLDLLAFSEIDMQAAELRSGGEEPFANKLRQVLKRRWRAIRRSQRPSTLPVKARHRLRIEAKTFRYTTDFIGDFFPGNIARERRETADRAVRDMQTFLGQLNDRRNVERLARNHLGGPVTKALGLTASANDPAELRGADKAFKRLVSCKPYWK